MNMGTYFIFPFGLPYNDILSLISLRVQHLGIDAAREASGKTIKDIQFTPKSLSDPLGDPKEGEHDDKVHVGGSKYAGGVSRIHFTLFLDFLCTCIEQLLHLFCILVVEIDFLLSFLQGWRKGNSWSRRPRRI